MRSHPGLWSETLQREEGGRERREGEGRRGKENMQEEANQELGRKTSKENVWWTMCFLSLQAT